MNKMRINRSKQIFLITFIFISFNFVFSQNNPDSSLKHRKRDVYITLSYGYPPIDQFLSQESSGEFFSYLGYAYLRTEWKRTNKRIGIGVNATVGFASYYVEPALGGGSARSGSDLSGIGLGVRLNYYFLDREYFQLYSGFGGGLLISDFSLPIYGEIYLGTRLRLGESRVWFFTEAGLGLTLVQAGLSIKI